MPFVWDEDRELFIDQDSGEELSLEDAEDLVDEIVDEASDDVEVIIAEFLVDEDGQGEQPDRWHSAFILILRDLYLTLAALGIGGIALLNADEGLRSRVQNMLDRQLGYLSDFASRISIGGLSIGTIRQRSRMYVNSSRSAYWESRDEFERNRGMVEEHWYTLGDTHVCGPCNEAEDMGWQPIGTFSQPGSGIVLISPTTMCLGLTSCRCRKSYR